MLASCESTFTAIQIDWLVIMLITLCIVVMVVASLPLLVTICELIIINTHEILVNSAKTPKYRMRHVRSISACSNMGGGYAVSALCMMNL